MVTKEYINECCINMIEEQINSTMDVIEMNPDVAKKYYVQNEGIIYGILRMRNELIGKVDEVECKECKIDL